MSSCPIRRRILCYDEPIPALANVSTAPRILFSLLIVTIMIATVASGCSSSLPTPPNTPPRPRGRLEIEDPSIRFNADAVKPGVSQTQVEGTLGTPDSTMSLDNGETIVIYAFFPDGGKFLNPGVGARYFSHSSTSAVNIPQLEKMRHELTFYRIRYNLDGVVMAVTVDRPLSRPIQNQEPDPTNREPTE